MEILILEKSFAQLFDDDDDSGGGTRKSLQDISLSYEGHALLS